MSISSYFSSMVSVLYTTCIIVGIILLFVTVGYSSASGVIASTIGYFFILMGILILLGYLLNNMYSKNTLNIATLSSSIYTILPFLVILGILIYSIYLLLKYKTRISSGHVASGYVNFTNISIVLILLQLYIFYMGTQKETFKNTYRLDKTSSMLLLFVGTINIFIVLTLGTILNYFTTDG